MTTPVQQMIEKYGCKNTAEYKNALKEVIQEVALCGLSRGGFFTKVAFYGGTALRIFYGLDRFSEDMDFSLIKKDENFSIQEEVFVIYKRRNKRNSKHKRKDKRK